MTSYERPLLETLQKDFERSSCFGFYSKKKVKVLLTGVVLLVIALGVFLGIFFLTAHGFINPPAADVLCGTENNVFVSIPLGTSGGTTEDNLSSFLLSKKGSLNFISLDGGDLFRGLVSHLQYLISHHDDQATVTKFFKFPSWATSQIQQAGWVMRNYVIGTLVGHPHLDHVMGLMVTAPDNYYMDVNGNRITMPPKSIVGTNETLSSISSSLFNNKVWSNFVALGSFSYMEVEDQTTYNLGSLVGQSLSGSQSSFPFNTTVKVYKTCHDLISSTAFLITDQITKAQIVFFSDTGVPSSEGANACNWTEKIQTVWVDVDLNNLRAIFIEVSFQNNQPDWSMYGHLRPKDLIYLLQLLAKQHNKSNLNGLKVIVQHVKPVLGRYGSDVQSLVAEQLSEANDLGVTFIMPIQGEPICI